MFYILNIENVFQHKVLRVQLSNPFQCSSNVIITNVTEMPQILDLTDLQQYELAVQQYYFREVL